MGGLVLSVSCDLKVRVRTKNRRKGLLLLLAWVVLEHEEERPVLCGLELGWVALLELLGRVLGEEHADELHGLRLKLGGVSGNWRGLRGRLKTRAFAAGVEHDGRGGERCVGAQEAAQRVVECRHAWVANVE